MTPRPVISLTTDFGLVDAYAGTIRGVLAFRAPEGSVVDITHNVPPQAVATGAFLLELAAPSFPAGCVHLVVIDPGVGSDRARLAIASGGHIFVGPDNGCLSPALPAAARGSRDAAAHYSARPVQLPLGITAVRIENLALLGASGPSATFEGRDVFAPAAAYLANGGALADLGPPVTSMLAFAAFRAAVAADGEIDGLVVHVDRYGNLITDIAGEDIPPSPTFELIGIRIEGLRHTYASAAGPAAIIGSSGRVEIAVPGRNAAEIIGAGLGDRVRVTASGA